MTRFAAAAALLLASCNPAKVDPAPSGKGAEADTASTPEARQGPRPPARESEAGDDTAFTAMGQVRCVTRARWAVRDCTAGVVRHRDGGATVTVFHPEGRSRDIAFDATGRATGVATAEADGSDRQPFAARRAGGMTIVTLGPERYEIPDALLRN